MMNICYLKNLISDKFNSIDVKIKNCLEYQSKTL